MWRRCLAFSFVLVFLNGCSMWDDLESSLWPSLSDDDEQQVAEQENVEQILEEEEYPLLPLSLIHI